MERSGQEVGRLRRHVLAGVMTDVLKVTFPDGNNLAQGILDEADLNRWIQVWYAAFDPERLNSGTWEVVIDTTARAA